MARISGLHHDYEQHNYEKFLNNFLDSGFEVKARL